MTNYSTKIKQKLTHAIKHLEQNKELFVTNHKTDFTRTRKLTFLNMINMMFAMNGNSIYQELLDYFNYDVDTASTSAFIQARSKIQPEAFKHLFRHFTASYTDYKTFKGYRLLAVDGSTFNIAHNPNDEKTYIKQAAAKKGYG